MELITKQHGTFTYNEEDIIIFKKGIMGLENLKKFIIADIKENPVFKILQSIEDEDVGLVIISPFEVKNNYEIELKDDLIEKLSISSQKEVMLYNTVTVNSDVHKITVNLKAPIVINMDKKLGEQIIIDKEEYKIKHPLIER
ncbi:flagellar assembly protein FliW [Clostridium intestinale]|uniref:Flagellar assembly factor FliW n=1 Tax=Clostridium intestinale URNW TaxID=1294142 RepID=U2NSH4_9CLOT|nr:flagellar assembly protein FliW [Clostridium intestinale]ERK31821.1 flagellar assembly protein FliW [Clostridium intestinale URNW]